jgi:serine/threonine-protein kinase
MSTTTHRFGTITSAAAPAAFRLSLVAGRGVAGTIGDGGPAVHAQVNEPAGVVVDKAGGIAVADASNRVRYVAFASITTIAGSGAAAFGGDDGSATDAQLSDPNGVAIDAAGGVLIADSGNDRIRRLDRDGTISTIAGGGFRSPRDNNVPALESTLQFPLGVAVDHAGNVYIADSGNNAIRRIDPAGTITTVAGVAGASGGFGGDGGPATHAALDLPAGVATGPKGELFIADTRNNCIRRVGPKGRISTVAGQAALFGSFGGDGGPATDADLNFPTAVLFDADEGLLIADSANGRVRRVDHDGIITTIAGGGTDAPADGALATSVRLVTPTTIASDRAGGLIVGDERAHRVWRLTPAATVPPTPGS